MGDFTDELLMRSICDNRIVSAIVAIVLPSLLFFSCDDKKKSSSDGGSPASVEEIVAGAQPENVVDGGAGRTVSSILLPASLQNLPAKTSNATTLGVRVVGNGLKFFSYTVIDGTDSCEGATYSDPINPDMAITSELGADGAKVLCVLATGTDGNGQLQVAPFQYTWTKDTVSPSLSLAAPAGFGPNYGGSADVTFALTASDVGTGLYRVSASVQQVSGSCLNAAKTAFDSACPTYLEITSDSGSYSLHVPKVLFVAGESYAISMQAEDRSQNLNHIQAAWTGTWDTTAPAAPASMSASAGQRSASLSWAAVSDAAAYLVINRIGAAVTLVPASGTSYVAGTSLPNGQSVVGTFNSTAAVSAGLTPFANYHFKVFAIDAAGNIGGSGASATAQPDDIAEFRGLTHAFVWGPGRRVGFEWQPFSDAQTTYAQMSYGIFAADSAGAVNFEASPAATSQNTSGKFMIDGGSSESLFVAARSIRPNGAQDANTKELRLRFGAGYHNKIGAAGRVLGADPLSQTYIKTAQAVKLDPWGNVLFSSGAGMVNVHCQETTNAYYCKGRTLNRVYTIAGRDGMEDGDDDSLASSSPVGDIFAITVGASGNVYLADGTYYRIRAICYNPLAAGFCNGKKQAFMYRFSGTGVAGDGANDSQTSSAAIGLPYGLDVDTAENLVIGDSSYYKVRLSCVNSQGLCTGRTAGNTYVVIGTGVLGDAADDVTPLSVAIGGARGLKVSANNNIYLSDFDYRRVRILCSTVNGSNEFCAGKTAGRLYRAMGTGASLDSADNSVAASSGMGQSYEVALSAANNVFVSDSTYRRVRVICYNNIADGVCNGRTVGNAYWVAGTGAAADGVNGGLALANGMGDIRGMAVTGEGNVLVSDATYKRIRLVCTNAEAGSICEGKPEEYSFYFTGSGSSAIGWQIGALSTPLGTTAGSAVDALGNVWFGDSTTPMVRVICYSTSSGGYCQGKTAGTAYLVAGTGVAGDGVDGLAIAQAMGIPVGIVVNGDGNVFVADSGYRRIRALCFNTGAAGFCNGKTAGNSYRFVGSGVAGDTADNVAASTASGIPAGLDLDSFGNIFIADNEYRRVRVVCQSTSGYCSGKTLGNTYRVAATGTSADGANATAFASSTMGAPVAIAVDPWDNVFVADGVYFRIRGYCVNTAGGYCSGKSAGTMYRVTGGAGVAADAANAAVAATTGHGSTYGIEFDSAGNFYLADATYRRIRTICVENATTGPCQGMTIGNTYRLYGNGLAVGDPVSGFHGAAVRLDTPARDAIAFDSAGNLIYTGSAGSVRMFNGY